MSFAKYLSYLSYKNRNFSNEQKFLTESARSPWPPLSPASFGSISASSAQASSKRKKRQAYANLPSTTFDDYTKLHLLVNRSAGPHDLSYMAEWVELFPFQQAARDKGEALSKAEISSKPEKLPQP